MATTIDQEISKASTSAPMNGAISQSVTSLGNEAYVSAEFFDKEVRNIFRSTWMLAGFGREIPNPGDVQPVTLAGIPIIIVRGRDGNVRAFHNVCLHRGITLVEAPCRDRKFIVCPYHRWAYDLEGKIRARPHFYRGGEHDVSESGRDDVRLKSIRCETWHDLVFVNIDGNAGSFADYLKPLSDRLTDYDFDSLRWANEVNYDIASNWKLIAENHIDMLHIFGVHPALNEFADQATRPCTQNYGHLFFGCYTFPEPEKGRGVGLPYFPGLSAKSSREAPWFYLFPNAMGQIYPDQLLLLQLLPDSCGRTRQRLQFYFVGDAATGAEYAEVRRQAYDTFQGVLAEDIPVCEALQRGRSSDGFVGGVLSPYWDAAAFQLAERVRERLGIDSGQGT